MKKNISMLLISSFLINCTTLAKEHARNRSDITAYCDEVSSTYFAESGKKDINKHSYFQCLDNALEKQWAVENYNNFVISFFTGVAAWWAVFLINRKSK